MSISPPWDTVKSEWEDTYKATGMPPNTDKLSVKKTLLPFLFTAHYLVSCVILSGLPWWLSGKEAACQCRRRRFDSWVRKIPWRRKWQPTPVFLPGKSHGQRSLWAMDYDSIYSKLQLIDAMGPMAASSRTH